jgi:hypothetical protein
MMIFYCFVILSSGLIFCICISLANYWELDRQN